MCIGIQFYGHNRRHFNKHADLRMNHYNVKRNEQNATFIYLSKRNQKTAYRIMVMTRQK
jgi:hypothetical protein